MRCFDNHGTITRNRELYTNGKCYCGEKFQSCDGIDNVNQLLTCKLCHNLTKVHFGEQENNRLIENEICFFCDFWAKYIEERKQNNPNMFVIEGNHYVVQPDLANNEYIFAGHAGQKFIIQPLDKQRPQIVTHNLWHQGDIPKHFRDILTDNAVFIN